MHTNFSNIAGLQRQQCCRNVQNDGVWQILVGSQPAAPTATCSARPCLCIAATPASPERRPADMGKGKGLQNGISTTHLKTIKCNPMDRDIMQLDPLIHSKFRLPQKLQTFLHEVPLDITVQGPQSGPISHRLKGTAHKAM